MQTNRALFNATFEDIVRAALDASEVERSAALIVLQGKTAPENIEPYLQLKQVAILLNCGRTYLYKRDVDKACAHRFGRGDKEKRYRLSEVVKYLESHSGT